MKAFRSTPVPMPRANRHRPVLANSRSPRRRKEEKSVGKVSWTERQALTYTADSKKNQLAGSGSVNPEKLG